MKSFILPRRRPQNTAAGLLPIRFIGIIMFQQETLVRPSLPPSPLHGFWHHLLTDRNTMQRLWSDWFMKSSHFETYSVIFGFFNLLKPDQNIFVSVKASVLCLKSGFSILIIKIEFWFKELCQFKVQMNVEDDLKWKCWLDRMKISESWTAPQKCSAKVSTGRLFNVVLHHVTSFTRAELQKTWLDY